MRNVSIVIERTTHRECPWREQDESTLYIEVIQDSDISISECSTIAEYLYRWCCIKGRWIILICMICRYPRIFYRRTVDTYVSDRSIKTTIWFSNSKASNETAVGTPCNGDSTRVGIDEYSISVHIHLTCSCIIWKHNRIICICWETWDRNWSGPSLVAEDERIPRITITKGEECIVLSTKREQDRARSVVSAWGYCISIEIDLKGEVWWSVKDTKVGWHL